ncbi:HET-domain-containing protein [Zopfia rhizophila CBS 207.26]|uniref:HET-domain-containing protein n=1 Tax=Zopfia rhizophila CBS 207.26 TaxID=1314779 RepID=A0A6A6EY64_9PEZI|nr:HET-domain-containing protein [Zopfia rhizophila CBS 207.26]
MPKHFQDAIMVTRRLGIQYLRIDSLCIIQDSVQDWREQSALMGQIYADACLNISISGEARCTELRGWIPQGKALSRRTLHFGLHEIYWECLREVVLQPCAHYHEQPKYATPNIIVGQFLIREYTRRSLTKETDRLPALSGLARVFEEALSPESKYVADIFSGDVLNGLLWTRPTR